MLAIMSCGLLSDVILFHMDPASETGRRGEGAVEQWDEGFHQRSVGFQTPPPLLGFPLCAGSILKLRFSLIHDPDTRPTPKEMLEHRWIVRNMKTEVPMAKWIAQVWGWSFPEGRKSISKEEWVFL